MRDIQDFIYKTFEDVIPYQRGVELRIHCPFCIDRAGTEDTKHHLHINLSKEVCHCFRCDYSGTWIGLVIDVTGKSYAQALGELYKVPSPSRFDSIDSIWTAKAIKKAIRQVELPGDFLPLHESCKMGLVINAIRYLSNRGFRRKQWEQHGLGIAESIGVRVIIPVEDRYWQARALYPFQEPKYVNPDIELGDVLFNSIALKLYDEVVICEGAFSAIAVGDNAVALLGKNANDMQMSRITGSDVERFIITIESGAEESMIEIADTLMATGKDVVVWHYKEGDPADSGNYEESDYDFGTKLKMLLE